MSERILILVATMSGTAELVAEEVRDRIEDAGGSARIRRMEKADVAMLADARAVVICSSTYGTGDVPDNGKAFFDKLSSERPDLRGVRYGVIALGDSIYPLTFCFGGRKFDELFGALGATRVGERLQHDSRDGSYPEELAATWADDWYAMIDAQEN